MGGIIQKYGVKGMQRLAASCRQRIFRQAAQAFESVYAPVHRLGALVLVALAIVTCGGCSTVQYYGQAVAGQARLLYGARDIDDLLQRELVSPDLAVRLDRIRRLRRFAFEDLHLPDNGSYRRYKKLDRSHVVWNVFAAPKFSVEPLTWCYPVAGCVAYRGYFSERGARRFGERLAGDGHDVFVGGVDAYSTLGRFKDPVLSTFVDYPEEDIAALLFHELAHQLVYVRDDAAFNESFASAVEEYGVERWFDARHDAASLARYHRRRAYSEDVASLMLSGREQLREVYASTSDSSVLRRRKDAILDKLYDDYLAIGEQHGVEAVDGRFERADINNALISSFDVYNRYLPAFRMMIEQSGAGIEAFYEQVRALAARSADERDEFLEEMISASRGER